MHNWVRAVCVSVFLNSSIVLSVRAQQTVPPSSAPVPGPSSDTTRGGKHTRCDEVRSAFLQRVAELRNAQRDSIRLRKIQQDSALSGQGSTASKPAQPAIDTNAVLVGHGDFPDISDTELFMCLFVKGSERGANKQNTPSSR